MTFIDTVIHGDALEELRKLPDNSIDALCCDPPAGINFMNTAFDHDKGGRKQWIEWLCSIMQEVYRVLRPGAHGLVWSLPRTSHWTATALEDAGFEIRDSIYHLYSKHDKLQAFMETLSDEQRAIFEQLMEDDPVMLHVFGSGFPKSLAVDKAIDAYLGKSAEREIVGPNIRRGDKKPYVTNVSPDAVYGGGLVKMQTKGNITAPASPLARTYAGYGSALKPSVEQWWLIRKPLSESSIAKNVMTHGTGAINIDACRIASSTKEPNARANKHPSTSEHMAFFGNMKGIDQGWTGEQGRFPSHLLLSHSLYCTDEQCSEYCPVAVLDAQSGHSTDRDGKHHYADTSWFGQMKPTDSKILRRGASGGASRYFAQFRPDVPFIYASKASRKERNAGCEELPERLTGVGDIRKSGDFSQRLHTDRDNPPVMGKNNHPTVKSQALMRYLVRMITPPNGVVLDCFAGSGSTLCAAISENFHYIGIEQEAEYMEIINARIQHALKEKNIA